MGTSPDIGAALAEVGGLDLGRTVLRRQAPISLPSFLLQVDGSTACQGVDRPFVAITFGVLRNKIGLRRRRAARLTDLLKVSPTTVAGILMFAHDPVLEDLWTNRREWADRIAQLQPGFVVAPDFSVWQGEHALAARYNLVRSVRFVELLQARGLRVLPHFYWSTPRDLVDIAAWINANQPEAIAIDTQCMTQPNMPFLRELMALRERLARPPVLLVAGIDVGPRLTSIRAIWPQLCITRNLVPEVAKHVDVRDARDGRIVRARSDEQPAALLERRARRAESWFGQPSR